MQPLIWGYKFAREIARRMPHFRGEPAALHPAFAPSGHASVVAHAEGPVAFNTPHIVYSEDDERALEAFARANGPLFHLFLAPLKYLCHSLASSLSCRGGSCHVLPLGEILSLFCSAERC